MRNTLQVRWGGWLLLAQCIGRLTHSKCEEPCGTYGSLTFGDGGKFVICLAMVVANVTDNYTPTRLLRY